MPRSTGGATNTTFSTVPRANARAGGIPKGVSTTTVTAPTTPIIAGGVGSQLLKVNAIISTNAAPQSGGM